MQYPYSKNINSLSKIRNTHIPTLGHPTLNTNTEPPPIIHNSHKNLLTGQQYHEYQFKTRENSQSQLKLSKMSLISASSLSNHKNHHKNNAIRNIENIDQDYQKKQQKYQWADHTFGDNLYQNTSNYTTKQKQPKQKKQQKKQPTNSHHQITAINQTKLNTQMKIKHNPKIKTNKTIQNDRDNQQAKLNSCKKQKSKNNNKKEIINSMSNIGFGLCSYKKKTKLITLTTTTTANTINSKSNKARSSSKTKKLHQTISISREYNSRSISKSNNNSSINSKYSTNKCKLEQETTSKANRKEDEHLEERKEDKENRNRNKKNQTMVLNSNTLFATNQQSQHPTDLQTVYQRVKTILKAMRQKQQLWQNQKNDYEYKIKQLQSLIFKMNRKSTTLYCDNQYPSGNKNSQMYNSINQNYCKNSNRNKYINHIEKLG